MGVLGRAGIELAPHPTDADRRRFKRPGGTAVLPPSPVGAAAAPPGGGRGAGGGRVRPGDADAVCKLHRADEHRGQAENAHATRRAVVAGVTVVFGGARIPVSEPPLAASETGSASRCQKLRSHPMCQAIAQRIKNRIQQELRGLDETVFTIGRNEDMGRTSANYGVTEWQ